MTDTVICWLSKFERSGTDLKSEIKRVENLIKQEEFQVAQGKLDTDAAEIIIKTLEEYLGCLRNMEDKTNDE